ncbi:MAG: arylesterase [Bryobacterales bacterium]|nr:arylesterase [Bryobacterales bacterium]MDE0296145.1 arylesterase [Bryobacterales bacterium]MDE0435341.1 arylesterase [Bryobacterales bacterium]
MSRTFLIIVSLLLLGCDSPQTGSESAGQPPGGPPQGRDTTPVRQGVIVAFGDSLTAGFGAGEGSSYPDFLQRELDKRGYAYQVINEGVSGDTTDMGIARVEIVTSWNPDFVIVAFGGNDGLRVLAIDRMKSNLLRMITELQKGGAQVILSGMKLPPNYGAEYRKSFEQAFADLAEELNLPFLPFLMEGVGGVPHLMQDDGIHPTAEGNERMALNVLEVLEPLLVTATETAATPSS